MSNTIIDALKKKGSTGRNNIMEAIENLPDGGGSGGNVEFIKLATAVGGGISSAARQFGGGGQFDGGKTLGELIGDKTIIGFYCEQTGGEDGQSFDAYFFSPRLFVSHKDILIYQRDEEIRNSPYFTIRVLATATVSGAYPNPDVYAICI